MCSYGSPLTHLQPFDLEVIEAPWTRHLPEALCLGLPLLLVLTVLGPQPVSGEQVPPPSGGS